jgi:branched-chain amino acid transport system ATP-binding protein
MSEILKIQSVGIRFGGVQALEDVSFSVTKGELLGLIGPNGAGKTTAIRIITGILRPDSGQVLLNGEDVTGLPTHMRIRKGIALTHQIVRPFRSMTVLDNVVLAAGLRKTKNPLNSLFHLKRSEEEAFAAAVLERVGLGGVIRGEAASLPLGQLKRLEVARALALRPEVLLLDEPLAGLNQQEATTFSDTIVKLNRDGLSVVLVEHNLSEVLRITGRLHVLDNGRTLAEGAPAEVMADPQVQEAYLGRSEACHVAA